MLRALAWAVTGVAVLALLALGTLYAWSEVILQRHYPAPRSVSLPPVDEGAIPEGGRLARIYGCVDSCHGRVAEGAVMFERPRLARIVAPDLTATVRRQDAGTFAASLRHGVRPDGSSLMVMPSEAYATMSDEDVARVYAYLRSLPPAEGMAPGSSFGPLARFGIVLGKFEPAARKVLERTDAPPARDPQGERGRYLAATACAHCHGSDLRGAANPAFSSPALQVVTAYGPEEFAVLMRTGTALGGRQLGVMGEWSRTHLSYLREDEVAALYAYLSTLGAP